VFVLRRAHAKVNLTLEVLGKRPDGYHEIRSIFRLLALHDLVRVEPAADIEVSCTQPELNGEQNLAYRAARLLQDATGYRGGAHISIEKAIPIAAGLGGGSSDGAAALLALNDLWGTNVPDAALAGLAAALGSDVPFFLLGGTALAGGRGERLRPLAPLPDCPLLLVKPPLAVSTAAVYRMVTADAYSDGAVTEQLAALPPHSPPAAWPLLNALQPFTCRAYPVVREVLRALDDCGATQALMCGSGPTCFGLFDDVHAAQQSAEQARARGWEPWVTGFAD
jgi:4-diphosphocytidyl-2-C-methyl-D-erythritol kinase